MWGVGVSLNVDCRYADEFAYQVQNMNVLMTGCLFEFFVVKGEFGKPSILTRKTILWKARNWI